MLLDAACPEPSPAPQERNAAPAPEAPASSGRDAGPVSETQPKQTAQDRDEKTCRGGDNGIASQDTSVAGKPQETPADSDPAKTDDNGSGEAPSSDGKTDGTTPQVGPGTDATACLVAMTLPVAGDASVGAASGTAQIQPDCQPGKGKTQAPGAAIAAIAQLASANSAAAAENSAEGEAPQPADSKTATTAPAAATDVAAQIDSPEISSVGASPTDPASGETSPATFGPTAFAETAGLTQATAPGFKQASGPAQPGVSGQTSDKDDPTGKSPVDLVGAISGKQANPLDPAAKAEFAPKNETTSKESTLWREGSQGQAKPDLSQTAALTPVGTQSNNSPAGTRIQGKASVAKTEIESTDQQSHRATAAHLPTPDTSSAQTIRPNGVPFTLPAGADSLSTSAAALVANQSAQSLTPVTQPALVLATPSTVPLAGLPIEIATQAKAGNNRFDIRLDPPELGRIDVRLDIDTKGNVTSRLMVERPETLDLLRRDAPQLERALQDAGLKTSDQGMQFSLRDQSFARSDRAPLAATYVIPDDDVAASAIIQQNYGQRAGLGAGIDIRV